MKLPLLDRVFRKPREKGPTPKTASGRSAETETEDAVEESLRYYSFRNRVIEHAPAVVTAVVFAFLILKVSVIGKGDINTTLAVLARVSVTQVVVGSILAAAPLLTVGISAALVNVKQNEGLRKRERVWMYGNVGSAVLWLSFIVSWSALLGIAVILIFMFLIPRLWQRRKRAAQTPAPSGRTWEEILADPPTDTVLRQLVREYREILAERDSARSRGDLSGALESDQKMTDVSRRYSERVDLVQKARRQPLEIAAITVVFAALSPVLLQLLNNDRPWMPAEVVTGQGNDQWVGYVLSQDERWLVLLRDKDRAVLSIESKAVRARTICVPEGKPLSPVRTLWQIGEDLHPRYEWCPDLPASRLKPPVVPPAGTQAPSLSPSSSPTTNADPPEQGPQPNPSIAASPSSPPTPTSSIQAGSNS